MVSGSPWSRGKAWTRPLPRQMGPGPTWGEAEPPTPAPGQTWASRAFTSLSWGSLLWMEGALGSARRGRPPFHAPASILEVVRGPWAACALASPRPCLGPACGAE